MIGLFWNIRGLGKIDRIPVLTSRMRDHHVDFVGIMETKKGSFTDGFLKNIAWNVPFKWHHLEANGTAGGILVGVNEDVFSMTVLDTLDYSVSVMLTCKKSGFSWKLVVIYGTAYEEQKHLFLEELENIMSKWDGPTLLGGDFNLVRYVSDE